MEILFYTSSLTKFNSDYLNNENLEDIIYMFTETLIESISLNNLNTSQVQNMSHLFENCSSL